MPGGARFFLQADENRHGGGGGKRHARIAGDGAGAGCPDDLLFAISFSGKRREINLAAQEALRARARAQVMAVTNFAPNELQHYADLTLYTVSQQQAQRNGDISSNIAQQALTDLLFMGLIQQDLEHAQDHIRHSEELVKKLV